MYCNSKAVKSRFSSVFIFLEDLQVESLFLSSYAFPYFDLKWARIYHTIMVGEIIEMSWSSSCFYSTYLMVIFKLLFEIIHLILRDL
jgi:hypothetical protein